MPPSEQSTTVSTTPMVLMSSAMRPRVRTELSYHPSDPYAVTMVIDTGDGNPVTWTFARQLLADGRWHPAGLGDVQIFPAGSYVIIQLASSEGFAQLAASAQAMAEFVDASARAVPLGRELDYVDLDRELADLTSVCASPDQES